MDKFVLVVSQSNKTPYRLVQPEDQDKTLLLAFLNVQKINVSCAAHRLHFELREVETDRLKGSDVPA